MAQSGERAAALPPSISWTAIQHKIDEAQRRQLVSGTTPYVYKKYTQYYQQLVPIQGIRRRGEDETANLERAQNIQNELDELLQYRADLGGTLDQWMHELDTCLKLEATCRAHEYLRLQYGETYQLIKLDEPEDNYVVRRDFCKNLRDQLTAEEQETCREGIIIGDPIEDRVYRRPIHSQLDLALRRLYPIGNGPNAMLDAKDYIKSLADRVHLIQPDIQQYADRHHWNGLGQRCVQDREYAFQLFEGQQRNAVQAAIEDFQHKWVVREDLQKAFQMQPHVMTAYCAGIRKHVHLQHFAKLPRTMTREEVLTEVACYKQKMPKKIDEEKEQTPRVPLSMPRQRPKIDRAIPWGGATLDGKPFTGATLAAEMRSIAERRARLRHTLDHWDEGIGGPFQ